MGAISVLLQIDVRPNVTFSAGVFVSRFSLSTSSITINCLITLLQRCQHTSYPYFSSHIRHSTNWGDLTTILYVTQDECCVFLQLIYPSHNP